MAKINGTCTGSSAAKYDVWLDITQNSQNLKNNTSNVTVSLKLQRNDGYASSAYNLNADDNNFSLSVGGEVKSSGTRKIDTRNSAVVVLATWTGNVKHDTKGKLLLAVSGSFTMGNSSLKSGSASGSFRCTTILRASSLDLGDTTWITPGNSFSYSIIGSSSFSHKISCQIGTNPKQMTECDVGEMTGSITIPKSWASYVTDTKTVTLNIGLGTYDGDDLIGYKKYHIMFTIPNFTEYAPSFDITIEKINNGVPDEWDAFVSGVSQFKAKFSNIEYKYGADFKSVSIKYNGITKNVNSARFDVLGYGEQNIVIRVTDTRGNYHEEETKINVYAYSPPKIKILSLKRCDEQGTDNAEGTYLRIEYSSGFESLLENNADIMLKFRKQGSAAEEEFAVTTPSPLIIGEGEISKSSAYTVTLVITDSLGKDAKSTRSIATAGIPFNLRKGGNGAAFGGYATNDDELMCYWDLNVLGKMVYEPVPVAVSEGLAELYAYARFYSCLDMVYIRLRLTVEKTIPANTDYVVAIVSNKAPLFLTPLSVYSQGAELSCSIRYKTGEITVRSSTEITAGKYIYINGMYLADYIITEG